jgi:hypothetical protein
VYKASRISLSPAARTVIVSAVLISLIVAGEIGNYFIAAWRADQAVQRSVQSSVEQSDQVLCGIIDLVTATPVPYPADPAKNPSRVTSYEFYEAFVYASRKYHCTSGAGKKTAG